VQDEVEHVSPQRICTCAVMCGDPLSVQAHLQALCVQWEEWGCPKDKEYYDYMKSYSPVDNIKRAAYPNILVTAGDITWLLL